MTEFAGLAGKIRAIEDTEQFDLGGYTEDRAKQLMIDCFSTPLPNPKEMVRITFVVGGGKLVRSRYNDDLSKWCTAALRGL